jgi:glucose/arabinose dehydrogenase
VPDVHGITFGPDALYFTTTSTVYRTGYASGQRAEDPTTRVALGTFPSNPTQRWTHGLSRTHAGVLIATQGVWGAACPDDNVGAVYRVDGGSLLMQAAGFRNPMYVRCHPRDEVCLVDELGDDSAIGIAREKVVTVRPNTWFGFPCCAYADQPLSGNTPMSCSAATVAAEDAWFPLNDTPFGLDWEPGNWPAPYRDALFVALHGSFYSSPAFQGTAIVFAPTDPATHAPNGAFQPFATGFTSDTSQIRRATDVAFGPDGRLYLADDKGGGVYWIAPVTLVVR